MRRRQERRKWRAKSEDWFSQALADLTGNRDYLDAYGQCLSNGTNPCVFVFLPVSFRLSMLHYYRCRLHATTWAWLRTRFSRGFSSTDASNVTHANGGRKRPRTTHVVCCSAGRGRHVAVYGLRRTSARLTINNRAAMAPSVL